MATPEHEAEQDGAHQPLAEEATEASSALPGESVRHRRAARPVPRRRFVIVMVVAAVVLVAATVAVAKVVNPGLAVLPPVIHDPVGLPHAGTTGSPSGFASASATPSLTVTPSSPPTQSPGRIAFSRSYEAEAADYSGGRARRVPSASGGKVVGDLDRSDEYVTFAVSVPAAGRYTVTVYYICGGPDTRVAVVTVNSGARTSTGFAPTGSWETVRSLTLSIDLAAGPNRIRFASNGSLAPDLDRITVAS